MKRLYKVMMFGQLAGQLTVEKGSWIFQYDEAYQNLVNKPPISNSLPKSKSVTVGKEILPFFDGLLPEGWVITSFERFGVKVENKEDAVGLFLKDAIGAASLIEETRGIERDKIRKINSIPAEAVLHSKTTDELVSSYVNSLKTDEEKRFVNEKILQFAFDGLERIQKARKCLSCLRDLHDSKERFYHRECATKVFGVGQDIVASTSLETFSRDAISSFSSGAALAGYQPKAQLFVPFDDQSGGTELILKPDVLVDQKHKNPPRGIPIFEHLTMRAASELGINVAQSAIIPFLDGSLGYATRRFDRLPTLALHMEDMLQATGGAMDHNGQNKFKGHVRQLAEVFRQNSERLAMSFPLISEQLALQTVFNLAVGNWDGHLKNYSIVYLHGSGSRPYRVAPSPAYDILPLGAIRQESVYDSGLHINGKRSNITPKDVIEEFKAFGAEKEARKAFETFFDRHDAIRDLYIDNLSAFGLSGYEHRIADFLKSRQSFFKRMLLTTTTSSARQT